MQVGLILSVSSFSWYLRKISFKLMINLRNVARTPKMAARPRRRGGVVGGGGLRLGEQMRQRYLPGAGLGNEDKSAEQRAVA